MWFKKIRIFSLSSLILICMYGWTANTNPVAATSDKEITPALNKIQEALFENYSLFLWNATTVEKLRGVLPRMTHPILAADSGLTLSKDLRDKLSKNWSQEHTGYATYTGSGYSGGCSLLDPIPSDMEITALNPEDYNSHGVKAALAGAYLQVEGEKGTTTVYVTDLYPEGAKGALDLCPTSFAKIGNVAAGKIDIKWHVVKAPVTGNLSYRIKEGSSPWWAAIQVRNHKYPVLKMEYDQNGKWIPMEKTEWNHFQVNNIGTGAIKLRITDINGKAVTDTLKALPQNAASSPYIVQGSVQFPD